MQGTAVTLFAVVVWLKMVASPDWHSTWDSNMQQNHDDLLRQLAALAEHFSHLHTRLL
jgi:hypothetical protein